MPLNHDSQGFLIGDPIEIDKAMSALSDIRDDIHAIRTSLAGGNYAIPTPSSKFRPIGSDSPSSMPMQIATPRNGRTQSQLARSLPPIAEKIAKPGKVYAIGRNRDSSGRFAGNGGGDRSELRGSNDRFVEGSQSSNTALRDAAEKIVNAVGNAGSGMEEADPTVKAFNEVAQPAARGYESLMSIRNREEHRKEGWFRKIFTELKLFRKEETVFNKAANSSLKNIEENPANNQADGGSSWLRRYILPVTMGLLGSVLAGSSKSFMDRFSEANERVMEKYIAAPIRSMVESISGLIDGVSNKIESAWNVFTGFVKDKIGIDIQGAADTAKGKVSEVIEATKESKIGKAVSENLGGISAAIKRAYDIAASEAGSALESVMPKGYRHKATFDGIKGGDDLSKNGTYTNEEADRIRSLKTSGANTSGNMPGGMSQEIQDKISSHANKHGLDPVMMQKIAAMESGGNPNAISKNGAIGLYQFTGKTASGIGIKNRFDVDQNIEGGMKLTAQNISLLKKSGLPVTAENIYMMHQLGPKGAQEIIRGASTGKSKADLSSGTQTSMSHNYGAKSGTASEYITANRVALDKKYAATISNIQTTSLPTPSSPQMPQPIKLSEAPQIENLMGSLGSGGRSTVVASAPPADVGQDVRDRGIAHIVTGGLTN